MVRRHDHDEVCIWQSKSSQYRTSVSEKLNSEVVWQGCQAGVQVEQKQQSGDCVPKLNLGCEGQNPLM